MLIKDLFYKKMNKKSNREIIIKPKKISKKKFFFIFE